MISDILKYWSEILLLFGGGLVIFISLKGKMLKEKIDASDKADDRLILILQTTVEKLEKEVSVLKAQQSQNTITLAKLGNENSFLKEILQGRDKDTQEFHRKGFVAISHTDEILALTRTTNKNVESLLRAIEKHLSIMETKVGV